MTRTAKKWRTNREKGLSDKQINTINRHAPDGVKKKVEAGDVSAGKVFLDSYFGKKEKSDVNVFDRHKQNIQSTN